MGPANPLAAKYMKEVRIPYNVRYWKPKGSLMNPSNDIDLVLVDWINYAITQGWISTSGGSGTNLSYTAAPTTGLVASNTGTDATIPLATATNAGLLPPVPATTALTAGSVDQAADYFLIWDASATAYKKILANFVTPATALVQETVSITGANAGASLRVTATATGTTASYASGAYTITIPAGETLITAHLVCVTADIQAAADGGGFTDWITFRFVNTSGNTGLSTLRVPMVQKCSIPTSGALAANNSASLVYGGSTALSVINSSSNGITIRMNGASIGAQGYELTFSNF